MQIISAPDMLTTIRLRQAGVEKPGAETFEGALKTGLALESLGLGAVRRARTCRCVPPL